MRRGPHPEDAVDFGPAAWPALRAAARDLSWLRGRGYSGDAALKLVGDRHALTKRQRLGLARSTCGEPARQTRLARRLGVADLSGRTLAIDGFNLLVTIEAALSGGVILVGEDECCRDLASMHGTYRRVEETRAALQAIGAALAPWGLAGCQWLFDRPVSNSGRARELTLAVAAEAGWRWEVELINDPDQALIASPHVVASHDSRVLDGCQRWFNAAGEVLAAQAPQAWRLAPHAAESPRAAE